MNIERTLETQRHRLLRLVAGLAVLVGILAVAPVSRWFSERVSRTVGSVLSRAEAAARCLVVARASLIASRTGMAVDRGRMAAALDCACVTEEPDLSLAKCRRRLTALRAILMNLPRHAMHLLRRLEKRARRTGRVRSRPDHSRPTTLRVWRFAALRIERPPDKTAPQYRDCNLPRASPREALAIG